MAVKVAIIDGNARDGEKAAANTQLKAIARALRALRFTPLPLKVSPTLADDLRREEPIAAFVASDDRMRGIDIRALLDLLDVAYVGPDAYAAKRALDKRWVVRTLAEAAVEFGYDYKVPRTVHVPSMCARETGVPTAVEVVKRAFSDEYPLEVISEAEAATWSPCVARNADELRECLAGAANLSEGVMVRPLTEGLAMSVFVYEDAEQGYGTLGPLETTRCEDGTVDYAALDLTKLGEDPRASEPIRSEIERAAIDCFCECGLSGIARIDLVWDGGVSVFVGLDPLPAFDGESPLAAACKISRTTLQEIVSSLVQFAEAEGLSR